MKEIEPTILYMGSGVELFNKRVGLKLRAILRFTFCFIVVGDAERGSIIFSISAFGLYSFFTTNLTFFFSNLIGGM